MQLISKITLFRMQITFRKCGQMVRFQMQTIYYTLTLLLIDLLMILPNTQFSLGLFKIIKMII